RLRLVASQTITTAPADAIPHRLDQIFTGVTEAIAAWAPEAVAVERIFYAINAKTVVPVAEARGVALLAAARSGLPVFEYAPLEVKLAIVGNGAASKDQVGFMVNRLLGGRVPAGTPDAADALAVAICHLHSYRLRAAGAVPR
ncbi:MAG TPA: crossover junction endodeoxyribonuclease RuvC, partial [Actinomycetota bacterium]|nr:crossover junction endodeoxyribonuclease RuvC [Actinomycetota bacterium]